MDGEDEAQEQNDAATWRQVGLIFGSLAVLIFALTYFQSGSLFNSSLAVIGEFIVGALWIAWEVAFRESDAR